MKTIASQTIYTDSLKVTQEQIEQYLDIDLRNCPKFTDINKLQGEMPKEIVQCLLDDMRVKKFPFPVENYKNMVQDTVGSMPEIIRESQQQNVTAPLQKILEKIDFKDGNCRQLVESYRELHFVVSRERQHMIFQPSLEVLVSRILDPLQMFLKCSLSLEDTEINDQKARVHLADVWKGLLEKMKCPISPNEGNLLFNVSVNAAGETLCVRLRGRTGLPTTVVSTKADVLCETLRYQTEHQGLPIGVRQQSAAL